MTAPRSHALAVGLATVVAAGGMVAHNVFEFGLAFVVNAETVIPLAVFAVLALLALARPADGVAHLLVLVWALLNLVGGGILSVLPLGLLPFQPEQSLGHYAVHVVYAGAQIPLIVVSASVVRRLRRSVVAGDVR
ncbi:MAG: hypothetical protein QOE42_2412 [Chloroflexota bacterium]|jgi:hypothetical protein|nr:hypothetical protein [Chloroflexota bacterium]